MKRFHTEPVPTVVVRRHHIAQPGSYKSSVGDPRRSGRAGEGRSYAADSNAPVDFVDTDGRIEARFHVVTVGQITINPDGGFLWAVWLPGCDRSQPRPALTIDKAKQAVEFKTREWLEASRLVPARRGR
jgi:hypothetical protein